METHSIVPPSSAHIWGSPNGCRAWALQHSSYPNSNDDTEAAREGTAAHEVAESYIRKAANPVHDILVARDTASNGVVVDQGMIEAAEKYCTEITSLMVELKNFNPRVEFHVTVPSIHELNEGTLDCTIIDETNRAIYVYDFKYGRRLVEVDENLQLINYAEGVFENILNPAYYSYYTVHLIIVQPRAYHPEGTVRTWTTSWMEMRYAVEQLHLGAHESLSGNGLATSGAHCMYCNARHACPAAREAGIQLYEAVSEGHGVELSPAELALEYEITCRALAHIKGLKVGYEEQLKGYLRAGKLIPGWGMKEGRGSVAWTCPPEEIALLGETMDVGLTTIKPCTPKQAITRGIDSSIIDAYSEHIPGEMQLNKIDAKLTKKIFS